MKKIILSTLLFFTTFFSSSAISYDWLNLNTAGGLYTCKDLVCDDQFVYGVAEFTTNTVTFGGTAFTNSTSTGTSDLLVFKSDTLGNIIWVNKYGGIGNEISENLCVDNAGNVIVTGSFEGTGIFDNVTLTSSGGEDIFVLKLSPNGSTAWANRFGSTSDCFGKDVCTDFNNDIYIVATVQDTFSFAGVTTVDDGTKYISVSKYTAAGAESWIRYTLGHFPGGAINSPNDDLAVGVKYSAIDSSIIFLGHFRSLSPYISSSTLFLSHTAHFIAWGAINYMGNITSFEDGVLGSLDKRAYDIAMTDDSKLLFSNWQFYLSLNTDSKIEYVDRNNVAYNYSLFVDGNMQGTSSTQQQVSKIDTRDSLLYGISITNPSMLCPDYAIVRHVIESNNTTGSSNNKTFYPSQKMGGIAYNGKGVFVGGENYFARVCFASSGCAVNIGNPPLSINPAPDATTCPNSYVSIGLPYCDYVSGGTLPYTFAWSPNSNIINSNYPTPLVNPGASTTYYLTVTDAANNVVYDTVEVFTTMPSQISNLSITPTSDSICLGDSVFFNASYTGSPAVTSWSANTGWNWFSLYNSTATSSVGVALNNGTNPHLLSVIFAITDSNGCQLNVNSSITILPAAAAISYSSVPSPLNVCSGDTVLVWGTGGTSYTWSTSSTNLTITDSVPFVPPAGFGNYNLTVSDSNSCGSNAVANLIVTPRPTFSLNSLPTGSPLRLCQNDTLTLWGSNTGPNHQYTWSGGVANNVPFVPTQTQYYVVTADDNGCQSSDSIEVQVINPQLSFQNSANQNPVFLCLGDSVTVNVLDPDNLLDIISVNPVTPLNNMNLGVPFGPIISTTLIASGSVGTCSNIRDTLQIIVNPLPNPILNFNGTALSCTGVSNISSYNWFLNGSAFGGNAATQPITQNGTYVVEAIDSNGCSGFDTLIVINLSTSNIDKTNPISIYPNPTRGEFTISSTKIMKGHVDVYNLLGKKVLIGELSTTKTIFDLSTFAKGSYFIRVISGGQSFIQKLILE